MANFDETLARAIDHTLLKAEATPEQIEQLCVEARRFRFASVCVNPCYVRMCVDRLRGSAVKVCTVVGFPLGASFSETKAFEAERALRDGAQEIDMVINIGMLKSGSDRYVEDDIRAVVSTARRFGAITKVILETCLLSHEEKVKACTLAKSAGAEFVKTSTGFSKGGASIEDVVLMRQAVGPEMGIKASGGIRTYEDARAFLDNGATRLGTSSSVHIVTSWKGTAEHTH